jgi:hypothetical protein
MGSVKWMQAIRIAYLDVNRLLSPVDLRDWIFWSPCDVCSQSFSWRPLLIVLSESRVLVGPNKSIDFLSLCCTNVMKRTFKWKPVQPLPNYWKDSHKSQKDFERKGQLQLQWELQKINVPARCRSKKVCYKVQRYEVGYKKFSQKHLKVSEIKRQLCSPVIRHQ